MEFKDLMTDLFYDDILEFWEIRFYIWHQSVKKKHSKKRPCIRQFKSSCHYTGLWKLDYEMRDWVALLFGHLPALYRCFRGWHPTRSLWKDKLLSLMLVQIRDTPYTHTHTHTHKTDGFQMAGRLLNRFGTGAERTHWSISPPAPNLAFD